jgi:hypothetical protein
MLSFEWLLQKRQLGSGKQKYLVRKIQELEDKIFIHLLDVLPYVYYHFYLINFRDFYFGVIVHALLLTASFMV